ncbi:MAG: GtrA family protein [Oscillospiraceae bacterium]
MNQNPEPKSKSTAKQLMVFFVCGTLNTIFMFAIYYSMLYLGTRYITAYIISYAASVVAAYYYNLKWVFNDAAIEKSERKAAFFKNAAAYFIVLIAGTLAMVLVVDVFKVSDRVAPILNMLITTPFTFVLTKYWAFRKKPETVHFS